jgi:hypothetical protein
VTPDKCNTIVTTESLRTQRKDQAKIDFHFSVNSVFSVVRSRTYFASTVNFMLPFFPPALILTAMFQGPAMDRFMVAA